MDTRVADRVLIPGVVATAHMNPAVAAICFATAGAAAPQENRIGKLLVHGGSLIEFRRHNSGDQLGLPAIPASACRQAASAAGRSWRPIQDRYSL